MPRPSSTTAVPAGVVTGHDYRSLLAACRHGGYALPAINVTSTNTVNAALEAAAKNHSDIIIQISHSGARFFAGQGLPNPERAHILGALSVAHHVHLMAKEYGIAVILHTDHANRTLIPWLNELITLSEKSYAQTGRPIFSSHMLDLSAEPLQSNLKEAETMLRRLTPIGMGLEIELGITGGEEDGIGEELNADTPHNPAFYTQPSEVLKAWERLSPLGAVSIAASFGNVHGVYKPGNIKLRPEILKMSQDLVTRHYGHGPNPLPLVFHGGSGSDHAIIQEALSYGVVKMNLDTDIQFAFAYGVGRYVCQHDAAFQYQLCPNTGRPLKKLYDPRTWLRAGEENCIERLNQAFDILGSKGKSIACPRP